MAFLYTLSINKCLSKKDFIKLWLPLYDDKNQNLYDENIDRGYKDRNAFDSLFAWKNNQLRLSQNKRNALDYFWEELQKIIKNDYPDYIESNPLSVLQKLGHDRGAIWRIFTLHIWKPDLWPIYDQHVHRAMMYIKTNTLDKENEIPSSHKKKLLKYIEEYCPFFNSFCSMDFSKSDVDKSLWSFGKFLKTNEKFVLFYNQ